MFAKETELWVEGDGGTADMKALERGEGLEEPFVSIGKEELRDKKWLKNCWKAQEAKSTSETMTW
jgi:predicted transcriptional regulator